MHDRARRWGGHRHRHAPEILPRDRDHRQQPAPHSSPSGRSGSAQIRGKIAARIARRSSALGFAQPCFLAMISESAATTASMGRRMRSASARPQRISRRLATADGSFLLVSRRTAGSGRQCLPRRLSVILQDLGDPFPGLRHAFDDEPVRYVAGGCSKFKTLGGLVLGNDVGEMRLLQRVLPDCSQ